MKNLILRPTTNKRLKCKHHIDGVETVIIECLQLVLGYAYCDIGYCTKCNKRVMKIGDGNPWVVFNAEVINSKNLLIKE